MTPWHGVVASCELANCHRNRQAGYLTNRFRTSSLNGKPQATPHNVALHRRLRLAVQRRTKQDANSMTTDPLYLEAISRFEQWFEMAKKTSLDEPSAMTLATVDEQGQPSARIVLLRQLDQRGFVFYTNSRSDKGLQLAGNPHAALCFYWDPLSRQVRVQGLVEQIDPADADQYWSRRPRGSQLSAWASLQSETLENFATLQQRVTACENEYEGREVPRPPYWLGYRVIPQRIEFWTRGDARLHERVVFESHPDGWTQRLLYP